MLPRLAILLVLLVGTAVAQTASPPAATPQPNAIPAPAEPATGIDPAAIRTLFTEKLPGAGLSTCDVFELNPVVVEELPPTAPVFRTSTKIFYLPNHGVLAAIRQRVEYLRPAGAVKAPFDARTKPDELFSRKMDYPELAIAGITGDYARLLAMGDGDRLHFLRQCGFLGNCTCLQEGLTAATRVARTAADQFAKFEPLVAHYVAETFKESAQLIGEAQREEIYQGLIQELSSNHALASRLVDVVVAKLSVANDTRIAGLLAAKLSSDDRLRQSMKGVLDSLMK